MSLFERLGGEAAVSAVVELFYELMLKDQRVSHFYESTDMEKLKCRQKDFITLVTGGPNHYEGTDMKTAHCKMNISLQDFDVTWENLENSLKHFSVEGVLIEELKAIFYSVQDEIVKKTVPQAEESFKAKDVNQSSTKVSKCPFSGKGSSSEGGENCPFKLRNNPYMKHYY